MAIKPHGYNCFHTDSGHFFCSLDLKGKKPKCSTWGWILNEILIEHKSILCSSDWTMSQWKFGLKIFFGKVWHRERTKMGRTHSKQLTMKVIEKQQPLMKLNGYQITIRTNNLFEEFIQLKELQTRCWPDSFLTTEQFHQPMRNLMTFFHNNCSPKITWFTLYVSFALLQVGEWRIVADMPNIH